MKGSEGGRREGRGERHGWFLSMLDPTDRLDLGGLSMATVLPVVPVLASMAVALHNVLVTTVTGILVAYPAREIGTERRPVTVEHLISKTLTNAVINNTLTPVFFRYRSKAA